MYRVFYLMCIFLFVFCSDKKNAENNEADNFSDLEIIEPVKKDKKSTSQISKVNVNDPLEVSSFLSGVKQDESVLENFKANLQKGIYSELELKQLIHEIDKSSFSDFNADFDNSSLTNEVKNSTQQLFNTVGGSIDKLMFATSDNPELNSVKQMIQGQLKRIENSRSNNANRLTNQGKENLKLFLADNPESIIYEKLTAYTLYGTGKQITALENLAQVDDEEIPGLLSEFFNMPENEVLLLKKVPIFRKYATEKDAIENKAFNLHPDVENHLKNGNASENFKKFISNYQKGIDVNRRSVQNKSKRARNEFRKLNPAWYGSDETSGNTYFDEKGNAVYLPLGDKSFADRVVSHHVGNPAGGFSEGALGPPDMSNLPYDNFDPRVCNIGVNGVLTLEFIDNVIVDVNGPDLYVFELGAIEPTKLEISKDGVHWIEIGKIQGGTAAVDIKDFVKPGETFHFVRLTDLNTPSALPGADVDAVAVIGGAVRFQLDSAILFEFGSYELKEEAIEALKTLVQEILQLEKGTVIIEGHTDNVGNASANLKLSEQRAQSVATALKKHMEASPFKWQVKGFGQSSPLAPNDTDENRQKNRRVEILVLPY